MTVTDRYGVDEMFVKMIDKFNSPPIKRSAYSDEVKDRKVLNVFAQSDAAGAR